MKQQSILRPISLPPLEVAAAIADDEGTLLLHSQNRRFGTGLSSLLFRPRWVLRQDLAGNRQIDGCFPNSLQKSEILELPLQLGELWRDDPLKGASARTGVAGYLSYDLGPATWNMQASQPAPFQIPAAWLAAYDCVLLFNDHEGAQLLVTDLGKAVTETLCLEERWQEAAEYLQDAVEKHQLSKQVAIKTITADPEFFPMDWYEKSFEYIQNELRAGRAYQVNLTGFATARTTISAWQHFQHQSTINPVSFAAYLNCGEATISSHSPERLLGLSGIHAETAPIKGTIASSHDAVQKLLHSQKDRAEHVMIVDLCRNDLGICSDFGSVQVGDFMTPFPMKNLHHLVSRIHSKVSTAKQRRCLLKSLFPGGSITGAPKKSAMQIIREVELSQRGAYTGSIGYVDRSGNAQWNIAIRTAVWQNGEVSFGCGGGIVLDSKLEVEYEEARLKASSFFESLIPAAELNSEKCLEAKHHDC